MSHAPVPPEFKDLVDLSADVLGAFALATTDDYFAVKENLLKPGPAEWREGEYTDKGKWMDGWESQRRRTPGHDWCLIRLGVPGSVHGALVDTTHFKGNAPQEVMLEGLDAPVTSTPEQLMAADGWFELLPKSPVKPDFGNVLTCSAPSARVTHVRLRIYPDGGVARLRVYGTVSASHGSSGAPARSTWARWRTGRPSSRCQTSSLALRRTCCCPGAA